MKNILHFCYSAAAVVVVVSSIFFFLVLYEDFYLSTYIAPNYCRLSSLCIRSPSILSIALKYSWSHNSIITSISGSDDCSVSPNCIFAFGMPYSFPPQ